MAYSDVGIVNLAAVIMGQQRISDFGEASKLARLANEHYTTIRDALLRSYVWSFATKRQSLPASGTAPEYGYAYKFPLPSDNLRLLQVGEFYVGPDLSDYRNADTSEYKLESKHILSNQSGPLKIRYIRRVEDPNEFDAAFVPMLAAKLAKIWAKAMTDSNSVQNRADAEFESAKSDAIRANAFENPPVPVADDTWVLSRL